MSKIVTYDKQRFLKIYSGIRQRPQQEIIPVTIDISGSNFDVQPINTLILGTGLSGTLNGIESCTISTISTLTTGTILLSGSGIVGDVVTNKLILGANITGSNTNGVISLSVGASSVTIPTGSIVSSGSGIVGDVITNKFVFGNNLTGSNVNGVITLSTPTIILPIIPTGSLLISSSILSNVITNKLILGTNITGSNNNGTITLSTPTIIIPTGSILTSGTPMGANRVTNKITFGGNLTISMLEGEATVIGAVAPTGSIIVSSSNLNNVITNKLVINNGLTGSNNNGVVTISQALNLTELFGESTTQLLTSDVSTAILSSSFVFGASKNYTCPVGFRTIIWVSGTVANCGTMDSVVDTYVQTNVSGVPTFVFQRTPIIDNSRLPTALTGSTMTISGTLGGFTISVTRQSGSNCYARSKWWVNHLEELV